MTITCCDLCGQNISPDSSGPYRVEVYFMCKPGSNLESDTIVWPHVCPWCRAYLRKNLDDFAASFGNPSVK